MPEDHGGAQGILGAGRWGWGWWADGVFGLHRIRLALPLLDREQAAARVSRLHAAKHRGGERRLGPVQDARAAQSAARPLLSGGLAQAAVARPPGRGGG